MICVSGVAATGQMMGGQVGLLDYAAAAGLTVGVLTFCFAPISGAHFNPAITLASAIFGHFPWSWVRLKILIILLFFNFKILKFEIKDVFVGN